MTALRWVIGLGGLLLAAYGVTLVSDNPPVIILRIAVWALAAVIVHDLIFAPACVAVGFAGRRLVPRDWWASVGTAALCSVVLVLLAVPVYGKPGARADNPTVLDRNYPLALWVSLAVVWAAVPAYRLFVRRRRAVHRPLR